MKYLILLATLSFGLVIDFQDQGGGHSQFFEYCDIDGAMPLGIGLLMNGNNIVTVYNSNNMNHNFGVIRVSFICENVRDTSYLVTKDSCYSITIANGEIWATQGSYSGYHHKIDSGKVYVYTVQFYSGTIRSDVNGIDKQGVHWTPRPLTALTTVYLGKSYNGLIYWFSVDVTPMSTTHVKKQYRPANLIYTYDILGRKVSYNGYKLRGKKLLIR